MVDGTTRRTILKTVAAIPLAASIGLIVSPLVRFLRPTLKPLDVFGNSDQPIAEPPVPTFKASDFPEPWTCIPFMFKQSYLEYNPEGKEVRQIPGFIVKLPTGDVVAYSRICPHLGCIFNFVKDPTECSKGYNFKPAGPVFACPCHLSVYDIAQAGKVVSGPAPRPPRRFDIKKVGDNFQILSLEAGGIA
ncbi:MAG: ubiquinol-cytochrome c reductase iron-sulfur subunit [Candidatus Obscuribacterales bacterium]|nr:ubiquinol-cytochrome c reductase iron-sulfur subunit [Candidatus Obscuribacterales bacterium]